MRSTKVESARSKPQPKEAGKRIQFIATSRSAPPCRRRGSTEHGSKRARMGADREGVPSKFRYEDVEIGADALVEVPT